MELSSFTIGYTSATETGRRRQGPEEDRYCSSSELLGFIRAIGTRAEAVAEQQIATGAMIHGLRVEWHEKRSVVYNEPSKRVAG